MTVNLFCGISLQSRSGGGEGIQKSGYDGSQLGYFVAVNAFEFIASQSRSILNPAALRF